MPTLNSPKETRQSSNLVSSGCCLALRIVLLLLIPLRRFLRDPLIHSDCALHCTAQSPVLPEATAVRTPRRCSRCENRCNTWPRVYVPPPMSSSVHHKVFTKRKRKKRENNHTHSEIPWTWVRPNSLGSDKLDLLV